MDSIESPTVGPGRKNARVRRRLVTDQRRPAKPIANHLSGTTQDMSQFSDLQGNLPMLLTWIVLDGLSRLSGEELAFRGFVQTRMTELIGAAAALLVIAVLATSILIGLLHTEYGIVGVLASTVDSSSTASCATVQDLVGLDPGARVHQHHRLRHLLSGRPDLRTW